MAAFDYDGTPNKWKEFSILMPTPGLQKYIICLDRVQ